METNLETRRVRGKKLKFLRYGYEIIDRNMFSHSRNVVKLEDMS